MRSLTTLCRTVWGLFLLAALAPSTGLAQTPGEAPVPPPTPQTRAATQPAVTVPSMQPLDAKVQEVLDKARQAYAGVKSYQDLGIVTTSLTIQGRPQDVNSPAATTFERPGHFVTNHEAMNLYSDGQTLWLYTPTRGKYLQMPLKEAFGPQEPPAMQVMLTNLPALCMLIDPPNSVLGIREAYQSRYIGQEKLADRTVYHITLSRPAEAWFGHAANSQLSGPGRVLMDAYFDTSTLMLLRLNLDMTQAMRNYYSNIKSSQGRLGEIERAAWEFNAGTVRLNVPVPADTFVFRAPAEAQQVDSYAALTSNVGGAKPVNDEEEAERAEAQQSQEAQQAEESQETRLPAPAPQFSLANLTGHEVNLADYRGKVVVLDFWATWCPPCRASLPALQRLHEQLGGKGLSVLAVDIGEKPDVVLNFVEKNKLTFTVLLDSDNKVAELYHISAIPKTYVIDRQGQIVKTYEGYAPSHEAELRQQVESLLGAASQPAASQPAASQPTASQPGTSRPAAPGM